MVNFMKHEFARNIRLCSVYFASAMFKGRHHLLYHLIEEDMSQLGVEKRAELEGDLRRTQRGQTS